MKYLGLFICLVLHSWIYNSSQICQLGFQSFSLIMLILLEVTRYILYWLKLDDERVKEELHCPVAANNEASTYTVKKKSFVNSETKAILFFLFLRYFGSSSVWTPLQS